MQVMSARGIAIYGTGSIGQRTYKVCRWRYLVACFLESTPLRDRLLELPVYSLENFLSFYDAKRPLIVVATQDYAADIVQILKDHGLQWGEDFITYRELPGVMLDYFSLRERFTEREAIDILRGLKQGKKLAILYGNCQMDGLQRYLLRCPAFNDEYEIMLLPPVFDYTSARLRRLYEGFWKLCDLFVSMRVQRENRFSTKLATEELEALLPQRTKRLWIPNTFFRGYFPQARKNKRNVDTEMHQSGRFPFSDYYVDTIVARGGTAAQAIQRILQPDFLQGDEILKKVETSLEELEKREKDCDIRISDYIREHYRERQLFYSENHPINEVIKVVAGRIVRSLGLTWILTDAGEVESSFTLKGQDVPIYPAVIKALGLKEYDTLYYANRYYWTFHGNLTDFQEEYLKWCWGMNI